jgi:nucleoside-diphosphate-sugar epimerase
VSRAANTSSRVPIAAGPVLAVIPLGMPRHHAGVIVTGSSGLIGRRVSEALVRNGYLVAGLDRPGPPGPAPGVENVPCDVTSDESVTRAVARVRQLMGREVASVIHLAAYYDFSGEPSPLYDSVTVRGTSRLLRALGNMSVEQFVFSSTMLVHAPCQPGEHINEVWPVDPKWDYPQSKLTTERLILSEHGAIPVVLLRIAGVYTDECQSVPIANQIQRINERRLTAKVFPGDTSTGQSLVHLDDLVDAFRRVITHRASLAPETVMLLGEADPMSYDDLQRTLAQLIHEEPDWETRTIPKAVAKAGAWVQDTIPGIEDPFIKPWMVDLADDHYALDITRARMLLGWAPTRHVRETLPQMVAALKSDPEAFYRLNKLHGEPPKDEVASAFPSASHGTATRPSAHT